MDLRKSLLYRAPRLLPEGYEVVGYLLAVRELIDHDEKPSWVILPSDVVSLARLDLHSYT